MKNGGLYTLSLSKFITKKKFSRVPHKSMYSTVFHRNCMAIKVCFMKVSLIFGRFLFFVLNKTYLVWTQSIGFPTYCLVVTAIENVTNNTTVAFVCSRNTAESIFTWFTYDFRLECEEKLYWIFFCKKKRKKKIG